MTSVVVWDGDSAAGVRRPAEVLATALAVGAVFQLLFWGAAPGLSFPLFVAAVLGAVWWVAHREGIRPVASTLGITAAAMAVSAGVAMRAEPLTATISAVVAMGLLAVAVQAFGSDRWLRFGMRDWLLAALRLTGHEVVGAPTLVAVARRGRPSGASPHRRLVPLLRGAALAVPVVIVLGALLATADSVFASKLSAVGGALPGIDESAGRSVVALLVAYVAAGALWHLLQRREEPVLADQAVPRVLGFTEAVVVLASVDVLFAAFVAVQVRYFFGGPAAVMVGELTYAEYARRGFGELVAVAAFSLGLHLVLAGLTRRESSGRRVVFTGLTSALGGMVLVIIASSFQRLLLYEAAFGFTRLRTVVHVFMVWLAVLVVVLIALEVADRVRLFLLAAIIAVTGFALTLNALSVDALIARHNVARAAAGAELDTGYLAGLSADAVPALVAMIPSLEQPLATQVADVVGCINGRLRAGDWRSLRLADVRARAAAQPPGDGPPPPRYHGPCTTSRG